MQTVHSYHFISPTTNRDFQEYSETVHNKQYDLDLVCHLSCLVDTALYHEPQEYLENIHALNKHQTFHDKSQNHEEASYCDDEHG